MTGPALESPAGDPRASLPSSRGSRLFSPLRAEGGKAVLIATVSTLLVLALIVWAVVRSPYWSQFREAFFSREEFARSFPDILRAFRRNIAFFVVGEAIILAWALVLAVLRSLRAPVFFPLRLLATIYVDLFRGVPTLLVVYLLGFGVPSLRIPGVPKAAWLWGLVGLILSYSAYVSEVYRAGIESVHPSQTAAARSLGLTRLQTLRYVVLPQGVRRVIPPLLNDFIALQKDTALIAVVAGTLPEAFLTAQIYQTGDFNFTPILGAALCFLVVTIPMTRLTDWILERQRRRRQAGATL